MAATNPQAPATLNPIPEARKRLGNIAQSTFYAEVKAGRIKLTKIGRRSFVTDVELQRYIESLQVAA